MRFTLPARSSRDLMLETFWVMTFPPSADQPPADPPPPVDDQPGAGAPRAVLPSARDHQTPLTITALGNGYLTSPLTDEAAMQDWLRQRVPPALRRALADRVCAELTWLVDGGAAGRTQLQQKRTALTALAWEQLPW